MLFLKLNSLIVEFEKTSGTLSWFKALDCSLNNLYLFPDFSHMRFYRAKIDLWTLWAVFNILIVFIIIFLHNRRATFYLEALANSKGVIKFMFTWANRYCWSVSSHTLLWDDLFKGNKLVLFFDVLIITFLWNWVQLKLFSIHQVEGAAARVDLLDFVGSLVLTLKLLIRSISLLLLVYKQVIWIKNVHFVELGTSRCLSVIEINWVFNVSWLERILQYCGVIGAGRALSAKE